jgi:hypothetical protein
MGIYTNNHVIMSIRLRFQLLFGTIHDDILSRSFFDATSCGEDVVLMVKDHTQHTTHAQVSLVQESPLCDPTSAGSYPRLRCLEKVPELCPNLCYTSFA